MRIAYLILAHKNFAQLGLLVKTLKEDWNDVFIHVDARSEFDERQFAEGAEGITVHFVEPRLKIYWAHVSIVHATLALMKLAWAQSNRYDRFVLLSGQDFPIVPNDRIQSFFAQHPHTEFLEFSRFPIRWWPYGGLDRISIFNFPDKLGPFWNRISRVTQMALPFRRRNLIGIKVYGSSQWFNLTGSAARYIVDQVTQSDILKRFSYTYAPDEIFFQTVLMNSRFAQSCVNRNLRYMRWTKGDPGPRILLRSDLGDIGKNQEVCLFARKFDSTIDNQAVAHLTNLIIRSSTLPASYGEPRK